MSILPENIASQLDFDTLENIPTQFIDDEFIKREADRAAIRLIFNYSLPLILPITFKRK